MGGPEASVTTALITGVTGQDGSYLATHLTRDLGQRVYGMVRGQDHPRLDWLTRLAPDLHVVGGDLLDEDSLQSALYEAKPEVVYNLGAVSLPALAWAQPHLTGQVTGLGVLRLLQAVRRVCPTARVVQAGSLASHGPYGAAKTYAQLVCADYRARGMDVSVAVFGGHHSPRRGRSYFSRKVTSHVGQVVRGEPVGPLRLGPLTRTQDWGWAADFMTLLPALADLPPDDYVISTGEPHTCQEWLEAAFAYADLDWRQHVEIDPGAGNVTDVPSITASPDPRLPRPPRTDFDELVFSMVKADLVKADVL